MPGTSVAKYRHIGNRLLDRIRRGDYDRHSRLPPISVASREFGVSYMTMRAAYHFLADVGVLKLTRGKGTEIIRRRPALTVSQTTVGCLMRPVRRPRNEADNFCIDMTEAVMAELPKHGYRPLFHSLLEDDYERGMLQLSDESAVSGFLLDQCAPISVIRKLAGQGLPVVLYNRLVDVPNVQCVTPDYDGVGRSAVLLFVQRGYERVAYCGGTFDESGLTEERAAATAPARAVLDGLLDAAAGLRLVPETMPLPPTREEVGRPEAYGLPRRKGSDWRPLAILTPTDLCALRLIQAIEKTDLELGKDVGVLSGLALEARYHTETPPTASRIDARAIGAEAVRALVARIADPGAGCEPVKLQLEFLDCGTV